MKTILIISPHFPPSNLAAVHRSRLFATHLRSYGWIPVVITVNEKYYEEELDYNLVKLLPENLRVEKVKAFALTKPRTIGDIGLRSFWHIAKRTLELIKKERISFLFIPIPSFYTALIGRLVHEKTGIPYGVDYIDPWVHRFPGSDKMFSRHWWSTKLSSFLEPIAIKKSSLITGVAPGYFKDVLVRNPHLAGRCLFSAMPYGGEKADYEQLSLLQLKPYLFERNDDKLQLVYAGAMLPKAYKPLDAIFQNISINKQAFLNIEFHFIGTGTNPNNAGGFNLKDLAEKYGLWQQQVFEYPRRVPYLDVLVHLQAASGIFILGSTEAHYTPSKVYQGVLSKKPIWAVLHSESTACAVIKKTGAGVVLTFDGESDLRKVREELLESFQTFNDFKEKYRYEAVQQEEFLKFSAREVTGILASALNTIVP